jgi:CheY-like chemotaxis protein
VVEDEMMIAMLIGDMVADMGHQVVEVAATFDEALAAAEGGEFDIALLDINLSGRRSYAVAEALRRRQVPHLLTTGYGARDLDAEYGQAPALRKPFTAAQLAAALSTLMAHA